MELKVAVCDDEIIFCDDIKKKIKKMKPDYAIDIYNHESDILSKGKNYDILFLDIEMPKRDGMSIANELRKQGYQGHIVFLTSHSEFMQDAFKVKAFRFLEKPVDIDKLKETIFEAEKEIFDKKRIVITNETTQILICISDILYIQKNHNHTVIHTKNEEIVTNYPLKFWLEEFGTNYFYQVHKSYLVSLRYVKKVGSGKITLQYTDVEIPVSRRNIASVRNAFFTYIKENARPV